jgi:hypothetical protein
MPQPKIEEFWTDPKHQSEREFMRAVVAKTLEEEYKNSQARAQKKEKPTGIFDVLFGGLFSAGGDERTFLQRLFDGE